MHLKILHSKGVLIGLLGFEIVSVLSCLFIIFLSQFWIWINQAPEIDLLTVLLFVILPIGYLVISLGMIYFTLKALLHNNHVLTFSKIKRGLFSGYFVSSLIVLTGFGYLFFSLFNESPPVLFPLNDDHAIYLLSKQDGFYYLSYKTTSDKNKTFNCTWDYQNQKSCQWELNQDVSGVVVASAKEDLAPLLDVPVRLTGETVYTTKQCIADQCKDFTSSFVGIKIETVQKK